MTPPTAQRGKAGTVIPADDPGSAGDVDADMDAAFDPDKPSKSQRKRDMTRLQSLGEDFAALPQDHIERCPIPDALRDAVMAYRNTRSHEGRRRQMQYIGKLMRQIDATPVEQAVLAMQAGQARDTLALHRAERWRDELLRDDDAATRWLVQYPDSDTQQLRSLIRAARKDATPAVPDGAARHGRAFRELFKFVKTHLMAQTEEHIEDD